MLRADGETTNAAFLIYTAFKWTRPPSSLIVRLNLVYKFKKLAMSEHLRLLKDEPLTGIKRLGPKSRSKLYKGQEIG